MILVAANLCVFFLFMTEPATAAFAPVSRPRLSTSHTGGTVALFVASRDDEPPTSTAASATTSAATATATAEARRLLDRARQMRLEIAALTGQSVEQVEAEAALKKQQYQQGVESKRLERDQQLKNKKDSQSANNDQYNNYKNYNTNIQVPETADEQIYQAQAAIHRAYAAGITRQTVRWALVPATETLRTTDPSWPGGAAQMYRQAAGPLTQGLLPGLASKIISSSSLPTNPTAAAPVWGKPTVTAQDIWDFDGSAWVTASRHAVDPEDSNFASKQSSSSSSSSNVVVQALVQPNTDNRYTNDIAAMDQALGPEALFLLVNPFWRDLSSWGTNWLAPGAQQKAKIAIFERGFDETYCLLQKAVRGEDCIAIKAYPFDWQLFAYTDDDYTVRLGSTPMEPKASDFAQYLNEREEFKMSKNMRQMQRMMNR